MTALRFEDEAGMVIATGSDHGLVKLYDLRSSRPILTKDHNSGSPAAALIPWTDRVPIGQPGLTLTNLRTPRFA